MEARLAALLVRYRYAFVAATLVLVAAVSYGAKFVWFNADYRIFFKPDYPQLVAHEQQQANFTRSDNVSFILAPKDGNVFTRETLAAIEQLTAECWRMPRSLRVDSITNFQYSRAVGDELTQRIKQVLLALDKTNPADKAMLDKLYGVHGYAEASLTNFQEVARVAASYGFVKKRELFSGAKR